MYHELVEGTKDKLGLLDSLDPYYKGVFDQDLLKIDKAKMELKRDKSK